MATRSSVLAWRTPGTAESGRLWSIGSQSDDQVTKHAKVTVTVFRIRVGLSWGGGIIRRPLTNTCGVSRAAWGEWTRLRGLSHGMRIEGSAA